MTNETRGNRGIEALEIHKKLIGDDGVEFFTAVQVYLYTDRPREEVAGEPCSGCGDRASRTVRMEGEDIPVCGYCFHSFPSKP